MPGYVAIAEQVPSGTALKTILQVTNPNTNPASHRIAPYQVYFGCRGITSNAVPARVLVARQTTAGAGGVPLTTNYGINPLDAAAPASSCTALRGPATAWGTEPTLGAILFAREVHVQTGWGEYFPLGDEIRIAPGDRIAVLVLAAATVDVTAALNWREGH